MQKKLLILAVATLVLVEGVFLVWEKKMSQIVPLNQVKEEDKATDEHQVLVTNVDPDVSHWQTKETDFFTIKFPKEWYWLESDPTKQGYPADSGRSHVITNNPNFEIDKYADIGLFTGGNFQKVSESGKVESIPLRGSEVVISFRASATEDVGSPQESIDSKLSNLRNEEKNRPASSCSQLSALEVIPVRAYCSFIDVATAQKIQTYFIASILNTVFFSARTTEATTVPKDILDKIAENMAVKERAE